jgi:hypothetical protein
VLSGDALLVEGVEAVDFVFFVADFEGGFAVEAVHRHDGLPRGMNYGAAKLRFADSRGRLSPHVIPDLISVIRLGWNCLIAAAC